MNGKIQLFKDGQHLAQGAAELFLALSQAAIEARGRFNVALSGGSTPKRLFSLLAQEPYRSKVDWQHCNLFFGDERRVPHDHVESNYHTARELLLAHVDCPTENIFPIPTDGDDADANAQTYQDTMHRHFDGNIIFDLIFLGLGADGHTASLFPGTTALKETKKSVSAVYVEKLQSWRITLSYPCINNARHVVFLIEGEGKAEMLQQILEREIDVPARHVKPAGELLWYLDHDSASKLSGDI